MPELRVGERRWHVASGSNLLDALNTADQQVPFSCRAGSCHACLVRCVEGQPDNARPEALTPAQRQAGWCLACQCQVVDDLHVELFNPQTDGQAATVLATDWLSPNVLRLRVQPEQRLRYQPGQHLMLWIAQDVARPYSLASLPTQDPWLEFHIDCRYPGAFVDQARLLVPGTRLRLGELHGGALHYDAEWQGRPLWLLASGTGLAPLWGILREALRLEHQGPIHVLHAGAEHYLAEPLHAFAAEHPELQVLLSAPEQWLIPRLASRQTVALACGSPASVNEFARKLFLAGVPRAQVLTDRFVSPRARG